MIIKITFISLFLAFMLYKIYKVIQAYYLFKKDHNPYSRECKKCGSVSSLHHYYGEAQDCWWEESYMGNNPKCKCHSYSNYRP